jgi:hypothetical protein
MTALRAVGRRCRQCGAVFRPHHRFDQVFCRSECRRRWHSWREARGARAVQLLISWRRDRRRGSLTNLTAFADELVQDYREHKAERQQHAGAGNAEIARQGSTAGILPGADVPRTSAHPRASFRTLGGGR